MFCHYQNSLVYLYGAGGLYPPIVFSALLRLHTHLTEFLGFFTVLINLQMSVHKQAAIALNAPLIVKSKQQKQKIGRVAITTMKML